MDSDWKKYLLGLGILLVLASFFIYSEHYEIHSTVFSANGWGKKLEFNVSSAGYYQFDVNILPGMRKGGSDIVLTDKLGNVLEFYTWSGYKIPYRQVYEVNYSINSPVFTYVPFEFKGTGGMGVYDENYNPILAIRTQNGVVPFFGLNTYYIGVGGAQSPFNLSFPGFMVSPDEINAKFVFAKRVDFHSYSFREYEGDEYPYVALAIVDGKLYFFDAKFSWSRDPWNLIRCNPDYTGCVSLRTGDLLPNIPYGFAYNGRYYIVTAGNDYEMAYYCSEESRYDPNNFSCYNGVRLIRVDPDGSFHTVWHFYLWDPQYVWIGAAVIPYRGKFYLLTAVDNYYGPDANWAQRPFFYLASVDPMTGHIYVKKKYYFDQFVDIEEPYPRRQPLPETLIPVGDNLYVFARYVSSSGGWKNVVLVFDTETLDFKYKANAQFIPTWPKYIMRYSGGYMPLAAVYNVSEFAPGYGIEVNFETGDAMVLGLRSDKTYAANPTPFIVPVDNNYLLLYSSSNIRTAYWSGSDFAAGYIDPSGGFHDLVSDSGCCRMPALFVFIDDQSGTVYYYMPKRYFDPSTYESYGIGHVAIIHSSDLSTFSGQLYSVSISKALVPSTEENVIHVRAYFPAPGTYYLYYDSDSSWYHLYPQAEKYTQASFTFSQPEDVHIRPHSYSLNVEGNGEYYTVSVEFNDPSGPVYSQCYWNGIQMTQVSPGEHTLTVPGRV